METIDTKKLGMRATTIFQHEDGNNYIYEGGTKVRAELCAVADEEIAAELRTISKRMPSLIIDPFLGVSRSVSKRVSKHKKSASQTLNTFSQRLFKLPTTDSEPDINMPRITNSLDFGDTSKGEVTTIITADPTAHEANQDDERMKRNAKKAEDGEFEIMVTTQVTTTYEPNPDYVPKVANVNQVAEEAKETRAAEVEEGKAAEVDEVAEAVDALTLYDAPPDAHYRNDPKDYKTYLEFNGIPGMMITDGRWDLSREEHFLSVYMNHTKKDGSIEHIQQEVPHPKLVKQFYDELKRTIVHFCIEANYKFCFGAFAEIIKPNSPLYDMMVMIWHSPFLTQEMRKFWMQGPLFTISCLRNKICCPGAKHTAEWSWLQYTIVPKLDELRQFFYYQVHNPVPIPNDVSWAWLKELGPSFTRRYHLATLNHASAGFTLSQPSRNKFGHTFPGYDGVGGIPRAWLQPSLPKEYPQSRYYEGPRTANAVKAGENEEDVVEMEEMLASEE
ncbi:hypothetical protein G7Y89_g8583 [Cudoniella acicularis]|uniref:Uncharacterized protein n=1 Tax=Cudoniella acicularis TaxID=354080 RepID=A0A8H4RGD0_9HELO|nr:hypothetical protein G7Y89_g8583 [Cudoniella acicularis]